MIQRIQSLYLLLSAIIMGVVPFFYPLFMTNSNPFFLTNSVLYFILFGISVLFSIISIFLFKNRQNQFVINRLNILDNMIIAGLFIHRSLNLPETTILIPEKNIGIFLPVISIIFLVLANKSIKKDEDLIRSADRFR